MAHAKLDFDDEAASPLILKDFVHNEQEELAEEVFFEELSTQLAENPKAMAALTEQYMKGVKSDSTDLESIQLIPEPGFVVKSRITASNNKKHKVGSKFFINVCYSNKVPRPPSGSSETEIRKAMNGEEDSKYYVPTVISNLQEDEDKEKNLCYDCDAIIHPQPYKRTEDPDFRLYICELAVEMIEEQFSIELGRPFAYPKLSYKGDRKVRPVMIPKEKKSLITEIPTKLNKQAIVEDNEKQTKNDKAPVQPKYTVTEGLKDNKSYLIISIETPSMQSVKDSALDLEPMRLTFNSPNVYDLDIPLPSIVNIISAKARFIKNKKKLVIKLEKYFVLLLMAETSKSPPYSFFDIVDKCDTYPYPDSASSETLNNNIPFLLDNDIKVGLLLPSTVKVLTEYNNRLKKPKPFIIENKFVKFASHLNTFELRTEVVKKLFDKWREEKTFPALSGWRDELYPIYGDPNNPSGVAFVMERCATPLFGVLTFGVHLNGFIRTDQGELKMWVAKRAKTKPTWPGWLDNTVAGGIPHTLSVTESVIKESMEEASLPAKVAEKALPTGAISYFIETQYGLQPEVQ
ncbi:8575_t:CDS:2 [Funneliformis geosporum]|uniref:PIH1 domain-containing protein 1 n=1 Tax=Funneliformis geosporum TaxID=1117311 RepID=A0A9W4SWS7_9GLOM|nr:8575_t:CDS:2 [Funneliformis geosporum]